MTHTATELLQIVNETAPRLHAIPESVAALRPAPGAWSIKEIVGHLIDSAANNHQRFVRAPQAGALSLPGYDGDAWVREQGYQERPWPELVELWGLFNRHLAHVISRLPESVLEAPIRIGTDGPFTLRFVVEDYVVHLRHHLSDVERLKAGQPS